MSNNGISAPARAELLRALRERYRGASDKSKILDEFVAVAECHRKHAIQLLAGPVEGLVGTGTASGKRIYDEAVREALVVLWEPSDRICGKRLKAVLPALVEAMERHGHLELDGEVRGRVLAASAATIDRLLAPVRREAGTRRKRRRKRKLNARVPIRTFSDWGEPLPGFLEVDFVAHCGGRLTGSYIHSLVGTDVCSGWTEAVPLLVREQSVVVQGVEAMARQLPVAMRGIDSDNDSAFLNETLTAHCQDRGIEFTRSRAYRKNDQAWIEQQGPVRALEIAASRPLHGGSAAYAATTRSRMAHRHGSATRLRRSRRCRALGDRPRRRHRHVARRGVAGRVAERFVDPWRLNRPVTRGPRSRRRHETSPAKSHARVKGGGQHAARPL